LFWFWFHQIFISIIGCCIWKAEKNILYYNSAKNFDKLFCSNESFEYWLNKLSDVSNFHGMQWHRFVSKYPLKIFWVTFIFFIIFSIPTILIFKATEFFGQNQISTSGVNFINVLHARFSYVSHFLAAFSSYA